MPQSTLCPLRRTHAYSDSISISHAAMAIMREGRLHLQLDWEIAYKWAKKTEQEDECRARKWMRMGSKLLKYFSTISHRIRPNISRDISNSSSFTVLVKGLSLGIEHSPSPFHSMICHTCTTARLFPPISFHNIISFRISEPRVRHFHIWPTEFKFKWRRTCHEALGERLERTYVPTYHSGRVRERVKQENAFYAFGEPVKRPLVSTRFEVGHVVG